MAHASRQRPTLQTPGFPGGRSQTAVERTTKSENFWRRPRLPDITRSQQRRIWSYTQRGQTAVPRRPASAPADMLAPDMSGTATTVVLLIGLGCTGKRTATRPAQVYLRPPHLRLPASVFYAMIGSAIVALGRNFASNTLPLWRRSVGGRNVLTRWISPPPHDCQAQHPAERLKERGSLGAFHAPSTTRLFLGRTLSFCISLPRREFVLFL